jgi:GalNAc-alpha-(1->4)-GalNAc-alpha-(1->3)-diNAcBac-PP-undecaprenol alpha-1,4-N-acetyl-D-galactosaminyltransferase
MVISTLLSGGAERNACMLANHLVKNNDVHVITFQASKNCFYYLSNNIKVHNLNLLKLSKTPFAKIFNFLKRLNSIRQKLSKERPDVLISFLETTNITVIMASLFLKGIKIKIISDRNNPKKSERPLLNLILKIIFYRFCNYLVLQTKGIVKLYSFINKSKLKIIQNTISENVRVKKKKILNKKLKFISVGRLEQQKGYDVLVKALYLLRKKNVNFECDIYGVGSQQKEIKKMIDQYSLNNHIFLKGVSNNILQLYHKYDLYILSSRFEGFPNSLLEALVARVVSVSSNCNFGPTEIISNNNTGIIFKNNEPKDLCEKIHKITSNKKKYFFIRNNLEKKFNLEIYNNEKFKKWKKLIQID